MFIDFTGAQAALRQEGAGVWTFYVKYQHTERGF